MSTPQALAEPEADLADPTLTDADERMARVVQHPDGWYWLADGSHQQFGPFDSVEAVLADMDTPDDAPDVDQTLAEAEQALGLADWVDPDTGLLAEDTPTHLEDH